jgi:molybdenum cofactor cytidylyltransferase
MRGVGGVLLAAGASTRFGSDKLLVPLDDGTPVAVQAARRLLPVLPETVAVVRTADGPLARQLRAAGCRVVVNAYAEGGIGTSIAAGVAAAAPAHGWLIALADMPFLQTDTIARVAHAIAQGALAAAACHRGRRGHPVGFASTLRAELLNLRGDVGARAVLDRHAGDIVRLDVDDPGVLADIDTPGDVPAPMNPLAHG